MPASPISPSSTAVCVLGAPRSGTSLTTRVVNLLGVDLGPREGLVDPPHSPNPLWECRWIMEMNERILNGLGGGGLAPPLLEPGWERSEELADERAEVSRLLRETFSGSSLWGWKDPRSCLTLPFWQELVSDVRYVVCLRSPLDSIASGAPYAGRSGAELLSGWLIYVASAVINTAGRQRIFVRYEDYFSDPSREIERLAELVGGGGASGDRRDDLLRGLVDEDLWHFRGSPVAGIDDSAALDQATALFELASESPTPDALDAYAERILGDLRRVAGNAVG